VTQNYAIMRFAIHLRHKQRLVIDKTTISTKTVCSR